MAPQTAISKAVCYKTKNEQFWEKAVHFLLVATNCFYAGLPTVFMQVYQLFFAPLPFISLNHTATFPPVIARSISPSLRGRER